MTTTTTSKKRVYTQNAELVARLRKAFEEHSQPERACKLCGRGEKRLADVALVHFVKLTREEVPAFLLVCPIGGEKGELAQLSTKLEEEARYHASTFKHEQSYAVICYAKGDAVLQQIRFTVSAA